MAKLTWGDTGEKFFEMGVSMGVLFKLDKAKSEYGSGVAWNGLINVHESPEGAEATKLWADNKEYASFRSNEEFKGSIEAYMSPPEFDECDGYKEAAPGLKLSGQERVPFAFAYRTGIGSDADPGCTDYKLHLVYNATASPSEREYATINDSPDAATLSWDFDTTAIDPGIEGFKPTAHLEIDSRSTDKDALAALEAILYGGENADARIPLPKEIAELLKKTVGAGGSSDAGTLPGGTTGSESNETTDGK